MTTQDERQAAALKTSISSYVGTATLAVIGGGVALFTYIQQNFVPGGLFYLCIALGALLLVVSFILGGRGADATARALATGAWSTETSKSEFNGQAVFTLLGLIFVLGAAVLGATAPPRVVKDPCVGLLSSDLSKSRPHLDQLRQDLAVCKSSGTQ